MKNFHECKVNDSRCKNLAVRLDTICSIEFRIRKESLILKWTGLS